MPDIKIVEVGLGAKIVEVGLGARIVEVAIQGPPGPPGAAGGAAYTHTQIGAADTWIINHNLGRYPAITLLSPGLAEFIAEVVHTSVNQAIVTLATPQTGLAQCS